MERGEVSARNNSWSSWNASKPDWVTNKDIEILVYSGPKPADLNGAPALEALVKDPEDRQVVDIVTAGNALGHPFAMPPGVPQDRLEAIRKAFADMRLPAPILAALKAKGIERPTPIQVQGLPVALSGRDMIGIAFTGSGKSMAFCSPLVLFALQEELRLPLQRGEGPVGVVLAPSRELAKQHSETLQHLASFLRSGGGAAGAAPGPELRTMLAIGGEDLKTQLEPVSKGVHMVVATPGRLFDHLSRRRISLDICRYMCLDEGDRMLDAGFDEDVEPPRLHLLGLGLGIFCRLCHVRACSRLSRRTLPGKVVLEAGDRTPSGWGHALRVSPGVA
jgi:hypothetical protein